MSEITESTPSSSQTPAPDSTASKEGGGPKSFSSGIATAEAASRELATRDEGTAEGVVSPAQEQVSTPEPNVVKELREAVAKKDAALTRASQRSALYERRLQEVEPYAQAGVTLMNHPEGRAILGKLQRGENLTGEETETVERASAPRNTFDPQTMKATLREAVREEMDTREAAKEHNQALMGKLRQNLPDFDQAARSPRFWATVDMTLAQIANGTFPLDDPSDDPYEAAMRQGYHTLVASNPHVVAAEKEKANLEAKQKAADVGRAVAAGGSGSNGEVQPSAPLSKEAESIKRMLELYRNTGATGVGRSFSRRGARS